MLRLPRTLTLALLACAWSPAAIAASPAPGLAPAVAGVLPQDLSPLFAAPTTLELANIRAEWASRNPIAEGYRLEATGLDAGGATVHVISHIVDGQRHFGAVRFPRNFDPSEVYRTIVLCHGGLDGIDLVQVDGFLATVGDTCVDTDAFIVIPSFRGERLETSFAGQFISGGQPSFADRDVDDTIAMLTVCLQTYPQMDDARVSAFGISRGGAVAMLLSVRDPRVRRVVNNFGFSDLSLPSVRARIDEIQNNGVTPAGIGRVAWETSVQPWLLGTLPLAEARLEWIRRSACYFGEDLPMIQSHHGLSDTQVDASHTLVLIDALVGFGRSFPDVEVFYYPSGEHSLGSFAAGYGPRAAGLLCADTAMPVGFCGPTRPTALGFYASADYRGSCSRTANDFRFRGVDLPPNTFALVIVSPTTAYVPSGAGFLCLGQGVQRLGVATVDAAGALEMPVDLATGQALLAPIFEVGQDAHFQAVFRDPGNPMGLFNFSNGLRMTVLP